MIIAHSNVQSYSLFANNVQEKYNLSEKGLFYRLQKWDNPNKFLPLDNENKLSLFSLNRNIALPFASRKVGGASGHQNKKTLLC